MRKTLKILITSFIIMISIHNFSFAQEEPEAPVDQDQYYDYAQDVPQVEPKQENLKGEIIGIIQDGSQDVYGQIQFFQLLNVAISNGSAKGKNIEIYSTYDRLDSPFRYKTSDKVTVLRVYAEDGNEQYYVTDFQRTNYLIILSIIFVILVILVSKLYGLLSILGLAYSFFIIFIFTLPKLSQGGNPVVIAILSAFIIAPVTFYLSHGLNKKTTVALAGTLISLVFTGLLSSLFIYLAKLTGSASEEALFLQYTMGATYNIKGLLLAGIIIGSLGILDDVTITQSSIIKELYESNNKLTFKEIFIKAMNVGHDHISSAVNTLILVYVSASLPLFILFTKSDIPVGILINSEIISEEVLRTLISSIGLILSIPLTTLIAAKFLAPIVKIKPAKKPTK